jgi:hypothetical protein
VRYVVGMVLAAAWLASCRPATGDASTAPSAIPTGSVVPAERAGGPEPAGSQAIALPYEFDRGCAGDVDGTRPTGEQLDELGRACAPGLAVLATTEASPGRLAVDVAAGACIRIGIVSSLPGSGARAVLRDPGGQAVAESTLRTPMLVPYGGPVCVATAGRYELEASTLAGVSMQVRVWGVLPPAGVRSE